MGLRRAAALAGAVLAIAACPPGAAAQRGSFGVVEIYDEDDEPSSLTIESTEVDVTIRGRLARTRVTQVFANATDREVEGVYRVRLPEGAAVRRMAMNVGEVMMEGAIAERGRARAIYEGIVASRRDPALLEQDGRALSVRIFPFPARGTKTIVLVYDEVLAAASGRLRYRYDMPASGETLGRFRFTATRDGRRIRHLARTRYRPRGAIDVPLGRRAPATWAITGARDGERIFAASWTPALTPRRHPIDTLVIALDTSASMDGTLDRAVAIASAALRTRRVSRVALVHGDLEPSICTARPVPRTSRRLSQCLRALAERGSGASHLHATAAGGASHLHDLLDRAATLAEEARGATALLLLSDGEATIGPRDPAVLAGRVSGFDHRYGVGFTAEAEARLRALLPEGRVWIDPAPREVAARIGARVIEGAAARALTGEVEDVTVAGAGEALAGGRILVVGRLASDRATLRVTATVEGEPIEATIDVDPPDDEVDGALLAGPWARAHLATMTAAGMPSEARVAFARRHEVLGDAMALLVLETAGDYERHGLPPPAAGDGDDVAPAVAVARPRRRATVPKVYVSGCHRSGDRDKRMIRRVVRARHAAIRHCYEKALRREPYLAGTVVARWWIDEAGEPSEVAVAGSSLGAPEVEACIVAEIAAMRWPAVDDSGAWTEIRYPFELASPDAARTYPELARALDAHLDAGDTDAADALVARVARRIEQTRSPPSRMLALLASPAAAARYHDELIAALRDRVARPSPPLDVGPRLFDALLASDPGAIPAAVGDHLAETAPEPGVYLDALLDAGHPEVARELVARWRDAAALDEVTIATLLTADARRRAAFEATTVAIVASEVADPDTPAELLDAAVAVARGTEVASAVRDAVLARCTVLDRERCRAWLADLTWDPRIALRRRRLYRAQLRSLETTRGEISDDLWITETAEALVVLGRERAAARRLSELVERWPDEPWAEILYERTRADLGL